MYKQFDIAGRHLLRNYRHQFRRVDRQTRQFRTSNRSLNNAKRSFYEVLDVKNNCDEKEIKQAFFKMAKKYHPDANPDDPGANDKFSEINEAYQTLSDKQKRAEYDMYGTSNGARSQGDGSPFEGMDMNDIFENLFGMGQRQKRERSQYAVNTEPGNDIQVEMEFNLEEVTTELKRDIRLHVEEKCASCVGSGVKAGTTPRKCMHCKGSGMISRQSGFMIMQSTCPYCQGEGVSFESCETCEGQGLTSHAKTIQVSVPAGVDHDMRVRIPNQGGAAKGAGPRGHVYLLCKVKPHAKYERIKSDLHIKTVVPLSMAILGGKLDLALPNGKKIAYEIKPGTQSGHIEKMRAKGMPDPRTGMFGHLFVHIHVHIPSTLDESQRTIIKKFQEEEIFREPRMEKPDVEHIRAKEDAQRHGFRRGF